MPDWDLVDYEVRTWPTSFTATTLFGASFRWLDDPDHTTVISTNRCSDLAFYGKAEIPAHNTSYHNMSTGGNSCFRARGRTAFGAGGLYSHDGRMNR